MTKAVANWEKKSSYLLFENVKYQTYVEALSNAIKLRVVKAGEKEVSAMLLAADEIEETTTPVLSNDSLPFFIETSNKLPIENDQLILDVNTTVSSTLSCK